jgi:SAM-dependent methyltransferase
MTMRTMTNVQPSDWVVRGAQYISAGGHVLDLACGSGRHTRLFLSLDFTVTAVDIDVSSLGDIATDARCKVIQADLEKDNPWPLSECFDAVIITNYLYRPLYKYILQSLLPGGILIYETFMRGNEQYGKPNNPSFLLEENELSDQFSGSMDILGFEQGFVYEPKPACVQRLCARRLCTS